jgi:hypothetical protein
MKIFLTLLLVVVLAAGFSDAKRKGMFEYKAASCGCTGNPSLLSDFTQYDYYRFIILVTFASVREMIT